MTIHSNYSIQQIVDGGCRSDSVQAGVYHAASEEAGFRTLRMFGRSGRFRISPSSQSYWSGSLLVDC